jgi:hypothetical protein
MVRHAMPCSIANVLDIEDMSRRRNLIHRLAFSLHKSRGRTVSLHLSLPIIGQCSFLDVSDSQGRQTGLPPFRYSCCFNSQALMQSFEEESPSIT